MPQQVLDSATGTIHEFPDEATPEQMQAAMEEYTAKNTPSDKDKALDTGGRVLGDTAAIGTGVLKAAQMAAGLPGDLVSMAGADPRSGVHLPTTEEFGKAVSNLSGAVGGPTELPKPTSPEGKYIEAGTRTAAGMMSGNPWIAGVGAASGVVGEAGNQFGGESMRGPAEAAAMLPLLMGLKAPPGVRSMQAALEKLGPTKQAIADAIDRGAARAGIAADKLAMPHTSLWSQLPELNPEIKELRGSPLGGPLNAQAADEAAAIPREIKDLDQLKPIWDPKQGWIDPKQALGNMVLQGKATASEPASSLLKNSQNSSVIGQATKLLNPFQWPERAGKAISEWRGNVGIKGLVEALASPNADKALKDIAGYSGGKNAVKLIARGLLSMRAGTTPGAEIGPPETAQ